MCVGSRNRITLRNQAALVVFLKGASWETLTDHLKARAQATCRHPRPMQPL